MTNWCDFIPGQRFKNATISITKWILGGIALAQVAAVTIITILDQLRKLRIPGGKSGYPSLPPLDTEVSDSTVTIYTDGNDLYSDMLAAISGAQKYIYFETYIWKGDEVGNAFKDALIAAAKRGVEVYCIYDKFGNLVVPPSFKIFPKLPHLHVHPYPLVRSWIPPVGPHRIGRDHRKIMVVDGQTGFVGGYNIGALYASQWRDTQARIVGPAVWELENAFVGFWNSYRLRRHPRLPDQGAKDWDSRITAALNTPHKLLFPVRGLYIDALERARKRAWLTSAYFIPDKEIKEALIAAAKRGVDVRILIPQRSNHILADWVSSAYFSEFLAANVRIFLYEHAMNHSKTATVDGRWSTIGTANIDRLSMTGNYEVNVQFHSDEIASQMEDVFRKDLSTSRELTLEEWENRSFIWRITERLLRPFGVVM